MSRGSSFVLGGAGFWIKLKQKLVRSFHFYVIKINLDSRSNFIHLHNSFMHYRHVESVTITVILSYVCMYVLKYLLCWNVFCFKIMATTKLMNLIKRCHNFNENSIKTGQAMEIAYQNNIKTHYKKAFFMFSHLCQTNY